MYNVNYLFVWCPKYRHAILKPIKDPVETSFHDVCDQYNYELLSLHISPDHVHLFLTAHPKHAPSEIAQTVKSTTAREMWAQHSRSWRSICGVVDSGNSRTSKRQEQSQRKRLSGTSSGQNTSKCRLHLGVKPRGTRLVFSVGYEKDDGTTGIWAECPDCDKVVSPQ